MGTLGEHSVTRFSRILAVLIVLSILLVSPNVRASDGYFKPPYENYGLDTDGDGYYNFLAFNATLQVNETGKYIIQPKLKDGLGDTITVPDSITKDLDPGNVTIHIEFDGVDIYNHGKDGPYLVRLVLYDGLLQLLNIATNQTDFYQYTEFQRPPVEFDPPHYDYGLDTNSNGRFDYLVTLVNITVNTADVYEVKGDLHNSGMTWITGTSNESYLPEGDVTVRLDFLGFRIRKKNYDGPYTIELEIKKGPTQVLANDTHITKFYQATDFEGVYAYFVPPHSDVGIDLGGDAGYEYLRVTYNIQVNESAFYNVTGDLYDKSGLIFITDTWNYTYLNAGLVPVDLYFLGCDICQSGEGGFYYAHAEIWYGEISLFIGGDSNEHKTNNYQSTDFACSPPIVFLPLQHSDHGLDTNSNTLYDYLVADISIDASFSWDYTIVGRLYDITHTISITSTWNTSHLTTGVNVLPLWLSGTDIYNRTIDGPYNLTLVSYDVYGHKLQRSYYNTSSYTYDEFEHEVADTEPPEISNVLVDGQPSVTVNEGTSVTLNATVDDSATGGSAIIRANYTIGFQNWPGTDMDAQDGGFGDVTEDVTVIVDTTGWTPGDYDLYVYGSDSSGNDNTTSVEYARITIAAPADTTPPEILNVAIDGSPSQTYYLSTKPPTVQLTADLDDSLTGNSHVDGANFTTPTPTSWPSYDMSAADGSFNSPVETAYYNIPTPGVGVYQYFVYAWDVVPNHNNTVPSASLTILDDVPPEISSVLIDGSPSASIVEGTPSVLLTATIDDADTGGSAIQNANYTIGVQAWPGWDMNATDGAYDETAEAVNATVDTSALPVGSYDVCVYAVDGSTLQNENTTGSCAQLHVLGENEPPEIWNVLIDGQSVRTVPISSLPIACTITATIDDSNTGGSDIAGANYTTPTPTSWPGQVMNASDMAYDSPTEGVITSFSAPWVVGTYEYYVHAWDERGNYNNTAPFATLIVVDDLPPAISDVLVNGMGSISAPQGSLLTLTAMVSDVSTGNSIIVVANYTDGFADWASSMSMTAADGLFDSPMEGVEAPLDTTGWALGAHEIYVYAADSAGNGNITSALHVTITITSPDTQPPEILSALVNGNTWVEVLGGDSVVLNATVTDANTGGSNVSGANYTLGAQNWPGTPMNPADGAFDSSTEDVTVVIDTTGWAMMNHTVCVYAWDVVPNENMTSTVCVYIDIQAIRPLPPTMTGADLAGPGLVDVLIGWSRSGDDGLGKDDVIGYDIYRAVSHSGPYAYVASVPAMDSPDYSWTCSGCGLGDPDTYFFYVEADNGNLTRASANRASKFLMPLTAGPQLISVPLILSSGDVPFALRTVQFDMAYYYDSSDASDPWKSYMPFKPYKGDLATVDRTMALWVNVTSPSDFVVAGLVPEMTTITLRAGWNLVGFPSFASAYTVADLKVDVNASSVEEPDPTALPYGLKKMLDTDVLSAGRGYWIEVPEDVVWTVTG